MILCLSSGIPSFQQIFVFIYAIDYSIFTSKFIVFPVNVLTKICIPPLSLKIRWRVDYFNMLQSLNVLASSSCFPAKISLCSFTGNPSLSKSFSFTLSIESSGFTFNVVVLPVRVLANICIVIANSLLIKLSFMIYVAFIINLKGIAVDIRQQYLDARIKQKKYTAKIVKKQIMDSIERRLILIFKSEFKSEFNINANLLATLDQSIQQEYINNILFTLSKFKMQRCIQKISPIATRLITAAAAIAIIITAIVYTTQVEDLGLSNVIRCIYLIFFAILLILAELRIQRYLKYVNFMRHGIARGLYIIFLGTIMFGQDMLIQIIVGVIVIALGALYILIGRKLKIKQVGEAQQNKEGQNKQKGEPQVDVEPSKIGSDGL